MLTLLCLITTIATDAQYRNVTLPEKPNSTSYKDYDGSGTKFWYSIELDGATSVMDQQKNMQFTALSFTGGYRLSEFLRMGLGFGNRIYVNNNEIRSSKSKFAFPIFINARGNFLSAYDRDGVPFWSINIGGVTKDGLYFSPSIGYSFGGLRNNFLIGLCYNLTQFEDYKLAKKSYSYIGFKIGYEF